MNVKQKICDFAAAGREHLNAGERRRAGLWALLAFGAVALAVELVFVLRGHRVARWILLLPLLLSAGVAVAAYLRFRFSHRRAVGHIDRFFDLKEGLVTADEHIREERDGEIHSLQLEHTERAIAPHDPASLRPALPRHLLGGAAALIIAAVCLLFVDDSLAVQQARAEEDAVQELSADVAEELEDALEEMLENADEEVAELLKDPELKDLVAQFESDTDRRAVMRKLSEIERRLAQKQSEVDTRADENYLSALAETLRQSKETAALGKALAQRNYRKAAEELSNMKPSESMSQKELKALGQLSARIGETEKKMSSSDSGARRNAKEMSAQIQKMMQEQRQSGQCSKESRGKTGQSIQKNSNGMKQLGARKDAQSALEKLRQKLQGFQSEMGSSLSQGNEPGLQAGDGVDRSTRSAEQETPAEGTPEHLSGQLGEGESDRHVENASSGSGTSSDSGTDAAQVDFQRQLEALVRREDIPEEMKHGVKTYFKTIQQLENDQREGEQ